MPIDLIFEQWPHIQDITITLPEPCDEQLIQDIRKTIIPGNISLTISFTENAKKLMVETKEKIAASLEMLTRLTQQSIEIRITL